MGRRRLLSLEQTTAKFDVITAYDAYFDVVRLHLLSAGAGREVLHLAGRLESMSLSESVNCPEIVKRPFVLCGLSLMMEHVSVSFMMMVAQYMMMMCCWKPSQISLSPGKKTTS